MIKIVYFCPACRKVSDGILCYKKGTISYMVKNEDMTDEKKYSDEEWKYECAECNTELEGYYEDYEIVFEEENGEIEIKYVGERIKGYVDAKKEEIKELLRKFLIEE